MSGKIQNPHGCEQVAVTQAQGSAEVSSSRFGSRRGEVSWVLSANTLSTGGATGAASLGGGLAAWRHAKHGSRSLPEPQFSQLSSDLDDMHPGIPSPPKPTQSPVARQQHQVRCLVGETTSSLPLLGCWATAFRSAKRALIHYQTPPLPRKYTITLLMAPCSDQS